MSKLILAATLVLIILKIQVMKWEINVANWMFLAGLFLVLWTQLSTTKEKEDEK